MFPSASGSSNISAEAKKGLCRSHSFFQQLDPRLVLELLQGTNNIISPIVQYSLYCSGGRGKGDKRKHWSCTELGLCPSRRVSSRPKRLPYHIPINTSPMQCANGILMHSTTVSRFSRTRLWLLCQTLPPLHEMPLRCNVARATPRGTRRRLLPKPLTCCTAKSPTVHHVRYHTVQERRR